MKSYLAGPPTGWRHPDDHPPPRSSKIQILTEEWVAIMGTWHDGARGWAPLLEIEDDFKERHRREDEARRSKQLIDKRWQKADSL